MEKHHLLEEDHQRQVLKEFNNLQSMKELVDWESFRPILEEVFGPPRTRGPGRRPWDYLIIFRSILLGVVNGLSDEQLQYTLLGRTSFKQFVGLQGPVGGSWLSFADGDFGGFFGCHFHNRERLLVAQSYEIGSGSYQSQKVSAPSKTKPKRRKRKRKEGDKH